MRHAIAFAAASAVAALSCSAPHAAGSAPTVDTLKQALNARLQSLKPGGMSERNVLFEDVRATGSSGNSHTFQVTLTLRDYGPGYPSNRYYGETCVGRMDKWPFTLTRNAFGEWQVEGRMTISDGQCKPNPAAGVSSIPVNTLRGMPVQAGTASAAPDPATRAAQVAQAMKSPMLGAYECWFFTSPRMGLNFKLQPDGRYVDSANKAGTYSYDVNTGAIRFKGGALDGQAPIYRVPNGKPTASFRNNKGEEISFCELAS